MPKTILIVEDNEMNMKLFNDLLQAHNYQTILIHSGSEAFEAMRTHQPDLVILDIQLPEISGIEVTQRAKADETTRHIPILAVTALAMKGDHQKILQAGCDGYLSKPISVPKFLKSVKDFLET